MNNLQGNISSNNGNGFGLHTNFFNKKHVGSNLNAKNQKTNEAYYAKKGEPMYVKEMDADEDGIVSLDEFKTYCEENGISQKDMMDMIELAHAFRSMQAQKRNVAAPEKESSKEDKSVYAKKGDDKYDEQMDTNNDDKVTYEEYLKYCEENLKAQEQYLKTMVEENEDGSLNITNPQEAINAYSQPNELLNENFVDNLG